jgi:hypothetical protein
MLVQRGVRVNKTKLHLYRNFSHQGIAAAGLPAECRLRWRFFLAWGCPAMIYVYSCSKYARPVIQAGWFPIDDRVLPERIGAEDETKKKRRSTHGTNLDEANA